MCPGEGQQPELWTLEWLPLALGSSEEVLMWMKVFILVASLVCICGTSAGSA